MHKIRFRFSSNEIEQKLFSLWERMSAFLFCGILVYHAISELRMCWSVVCGFVFVMRSKLKMVTSHVLTADCSQLLLGTDGGSIHVFDAETFSMTDKFFLHDQILHE